VIKQFGGTGYESSDVMVIDEVEMQRHQQLEKLYRSTRNGRVGDPFFFFLNLNLNLSLTLCLLSLFLKLAAHFVSCLIIG
jgi:hypothetical protein